MKVRKNSLYRFKATGWDLFDARANTPRNGDIVRVVQCHGCPPPNTMGHAHVATPEGKFIGLVATASLNKLKG